MRDAVLTSEAARSLAESTAADAVLPGDIRPLLLDRATPGALMDARLDRCSRARPASWVDGSLTGC